MMKPLDEIYQNLKEAAIDHLQKDMPVNGYLLAKNAKIAKTLLDIENEDMERLGRNKLYRVVQNSYKYELLPAAFASTKRPTIKLSPDWYILFKNSEIVDKLKSKTDISEVEELTSEYLTLKNGEVYSL